MSSPVCCYCELDTENGSSDSKIRCMGPCNSFVQVECVKLPKETLKAFENCPELHFYCKLCQRYSSVGIRESLDNVSKHINNLSDALKPLSSLNFNTMIQSFNNRNTEQLLTPNKRRLLNDRSIHQTNTERISSISGTKTSNALSTVVIEQRKSLVISHLSNTTTEKLIDDYIKANIGDIVASEIRCSMLLPTGKKAEELKYISFRISAPEKVFIMLHRSEVQLREYIYKPRENKNKSLEPVSFLTGR